MKKIPQLSDEPDDGESSERAPLADRPGGEGARATVADAPGGTTPDGAHPAGLGSTDRVVPRRGRPAGNASGGKGSRTRARRHARERALQALYQWDLASAESSDVKRQFLDRQDMSRVDVAYFERLFRGVSHDVERVDGVLGEALDRPIADLDPIERAVLRVAAFELAEVPETPARVAINEGVEITKRFGADNGHRYVNGVLDRLAGTLRPLEMRRG